LLLPLALTAASCRRQPRAHTSAPTAALPPAAPAPAPFVVPPPPPAPRGTHLAIAYSSNDIGEYEPCG
jgi:hypothetical protein